MLQEGLFICNAIRAGCTGFWLWFLLFGHYRETPGSSKTMQLFWGWQVPHVLFEDPYPRLAALRLAVQPLHNRFLILDFCKRKSSSTYISFAIDLEKEISLSSLSSSVK